MTINAERCWRIRARASELRESLDRARLLIYGRQARRTRRPARPDGFEQLAMRRARSRPSLALGGDRHDHLEPPSGHLLVHWPQAAAVCLVATPVLIGNKALWQNRDP